MVAGLCVCVSLCNSNLILEAHEKLSADTYTKVQHKNYLILVFDLLFKALVSSYSTICSPKCIQSQVKTNLFTHSCRLLFN